VTRAHGMAGGDEDTTGDVDSGEFDVPETTVDNAPAIPPPDALILGEVDDLLNEPSLITGPGMRDGRVANFIFYASGSTSRILRPDAIPVIAETDATMPNTPIENFVLGCIDGVHTVLEIQRSAGLAPHEITVALLTLLDKGLVRMIVPEDVSNEAHVSSEFEGEELTERSGVPDFQPLTEVPDDAFSPGSWENDVSAEHDPLSQET
jgi:hypothetical protein